MNGIRPTQACVEGRQHLRIVSSPSSAACPMNLASSSHQNAPVLDEEIGNAIRLTQGGKVVNERLLG